MKDFIIAFLSAFLLLVCIALGSLLFDLLIALLLKIGGVLLASIAMLTIAALLITISSKW